MLRLFSHKSPLTVHFFYKVSVLLRLQFQCGRLMNDICNVREKERGILLICQKEQQTEVALNAAKKELNFSPMQQRTHGAKQQHF